MGVFPVKSGDPYKFTLSWQKDTEEQILAGEFLTKLGNKKSKFIIQLICDYISAHPEIIDTKETLKFIIKSTSLGEMMTETIKSMIQTELADKMVSEQAFENSAMINKPDSDINTSLDDMFGNLEIWNNP